MKKLLLISFLMLFSIMTFAQKKGKGFKVTVKSEIKDCWVGLINKKDVNESQFGWWSAWKSVKENKQYKTAPATFTNVESGNYIVIIYNPASKNFTYQEGVQNSDGVVLEEAVINKNTDFNIKKGDFKGWYCLSCPYLYVWNGNDYVKVTEVIQDIVGKKAEGTSKTKIAHKQIINNKLKIRIQEEKDETSYLNGVVLKVGNETYFPVQTSLKNVDNDYLTLNKGEMVEITFELNGNISPETPIFLETTGYYEPNAEFLAQIYQKYLRNK